MKRENDLMTTVWTHLSRWVFPPEDFLGLRKFCGWQVHFHSLCRPWYVLDLSQGDTIISAPAQKERLAHEMCACHANSLKWITAWSRKSMRSLTVTIHLYIYTLIVLYICLCVCVYLYIYSYIPKQWWVTKTMLWHYLWRLTMQTS